MQFPLAEVWLLNVHNGNRDALILEIDLSTFRFACAIDNYFLSFLRKDLHCLFRRGRNFNETIFSTKTVRHFVFVVHVEQFICPVFPNAIWVKSGLKKQLNAVGAVFVAFEGRCIFVPTVHSTCNKNRIYIFLISRNVTEYVCFLR